MKRTIRRVHPLVFLARRGGDHPPGALRQLLVAGPVQRLLLERVGVPHVASGGEHVAAVHVQARRGFVPEAPGHVHRLRAHGQGRAAAEARFRLPPCSRHAVFFSDPDGTRMVGQAPWSWGGARRPAGKLTLSRLSFGARQEALDFQCRPALKGLASQLERIRGLLGGVRLKLCYEASHAGFSLQRDLRMQGYDREVVASTSIPRRPGKAVEIVDVKRFANPRQLTSWVGMDIREYASGGKSDRLGITRQGNRYPRTAFIEANQRGYRTTRLIEDIKARRAGAKPEYVAIADRCLRRLNRKGNRLLLAGRHPNNVKVACAREMVDIVWKFLRAAA